MSFWKNIKELFQVDSEPVEVKTCDYTLELSKDELAYLRDVFSIRMPPDYQVTMSQRLGAATNASAVEEKLWKMICEACLACELPVGHAAPDYIVCNTTLPVLDIFQINSEQLAAALQPADKTEKVSDEQ